MRSKARSSRYAPSAAPCPRRPGRTRNLVSRQQRPALGDDVGETHAQANHRLGDLRPHAGDQALGAHEARGVHGIDQMLRRKGVHGRNARDVDDGHLCLGRGNPLEQGL